MTEPAVGSETGAVTVAGLLRARAAERPEQLAFTFLTDGEAEGGRLTYGELDRRAAAIAAALAGSVRPGERALLLYPPGLDFIAAFFGCLYAGVVAVPAYPPRPNDRSQSRLRAITRDAAPRAALTTEAILAGAFEPRGLLAVAPELAGLRWIPTDALSSSAETAAALLREPDPESVAFLQYTSGSTATPKGVMVTHANLLHNERMIGAAFGMDEDSVVIGWLPLYHDMGLIGNVLQPLHAGATCVLMSPVAFLQRPMRWLEAIGRYRGTTSGGPNFAYELCVRKASPEALGGLDLASWRVAFNGAEPVRAATLERFATTFAPCGFRPEAFYPCYGLAEATLFVSGGPPGQAPRVDSGGRRVSCGHAWLGQRIAVADPETGVEAAPGAEGEVWLAGPSVARGYWENPAATARDFNAFLATGAGPFLRTGDLGFLLGGELYVTGRLKDLIILRGRNLYPQDVELTAEGAHPDLRPGGGAAFAVETAENDGEERLVIVHEVERRRGTGDVDSIEEIAEALRRAVAAEHEVQIHEVVLIRQGGLPKTSSGKVQRRLCRDLYLAGELPVVGRSALAAADPAPEIGITLKAALTPESWAHWNQLEPAERRGMLAAWLRERAATVLGVAASSISTQPLTALGLDSLTAVELKGSVEAALGLTVPLADLLQGIGVEELAGRMLSQAPETGALPPRALSLAGDQPLSAGQRALWFLERLASEAGTYNVAVAARALKGVDTEALRRALTRLTERHAALRTVIRAADGEPFQRAVPGLRPDVAVEDGREWSAEELRVRLGREAWRPFDLATGPLLRARIYELAGGERALLLAVHHLVCDFWSLAVMARELGAIYREETGGPSARLAFPALQYADFVHWQRESLARGDGMDFWRQELAGVRDLDLPTDRPRPPVQGWRGFARAAELPAELAGELRGLAAGQGATLFAALLAAFQAQLGRYAGHDGFAVGTPTAGRGAPEWAGVVGYFVNPVALRADLAGDPPFHDLLDRARRTSLAALEHAEVPFVLLAERLRPVRDPARPPLFQVMLALQQRRPGDDPGLPAFALGEDGARISLATLELESIGLAERRAQFEISLNAAELASGALGLSIEVNADLFDAATAERILGHFRTLLAAAVEEPGRALSDLPLLTAAEREELLRDWRATAAPSGPAPALTLHELVMEQARQTPDALAVVAGEERLTYGELMERSGALARRLRQFGVRPEIPVALCVERSADLVVGVLGILQAGGVYLPLDPDSSAARLGFVLQDAGAAALVTQGRVIARLPETGTPVLLLDDFLQDEEAGPEPPAVLPDHLAYLIYTSGSTGRPKGVAVTHAAAVEHCLTWARAYRMGERDRVLQFPSAGFDASVEQIFSALLTGATLALRGPEMWGPRELSGRIVELGLTIVDLPTAFFSRWVQDAGDLGVPPSLRVIGTYGEELRAETVRRWSATPLAGVPLLNCYGPTETVVSATLHRVRPEEGETGPVPIGRALPGRVARVLDPLGHPRPDGFPGELALSGPLARGYLGRPDLTAERFTPDPFGAPGSRLYRSGDLARRRPDGAIEFLGRLDDQVKVRGFRVEPGEIEAVLAEHPEVREAAVLAMAGLDGDRRLVAFVAPQIPDGLLAFLRQRLPDFMLPAAWAALPVLPLNANGKVDRAVLAARAGEAEAPEAAGEEEARTPEEELLAGIWADLLGRGRVGVHDDFFALGGHSLLATRVVARVSRLFGIDLPVSALFQTPTVAGLAARIAGATAMPGTEAAPPVRPVPRPPGAALPLSFAQRRLWFLDQLEPGSAVYNVPGEVRLAGALDAPALAAAFGEVLRRHEALRAVFLTERGEPVQRIGPAAVRMPLVDLSALPDRARALEAERRARAEARRPFDLAQGPVCRALLLRLERVNHRLCVTFHHIAADDWSLDLFLDELSSLYGAISTGNVPALPELPVQYPDFAVWQRDWLSGGELERQLAYWRGRLAGLPVLELPADRPRPAVRDPRGAVRSLVLPAATAEAVAALARREGVTLFMALLGIFQTLLARVTGETTIPVGSPVANRRRPEVERLIGLFVNTLVLDVRVGDDPALRDLLARVREAALSAYTHQDLPFERLVEELAPSRDLSQNPLFQVVLVLEEPLPARSAAGLSLEPVRRDSGTAKFDLVLAVSPRPDGGWDVFAEHSAALYDRATIERLLGQWRTLLEGAAAAGPSTPLSRLPLLTAPERQQIHAEWNDTRAVFPAGLRLHDLIAAQAARTPDVVAVVGEGERVTYRGLMERAGRLARFLRAEGVGPESRVGLCLERSPELLAGILGILRAGGAYLPLDPAYPQERLELMLEDAGAELLVTQSSLAGRFGFFAGRTVLLDLDADRARIDAAPEVENPEADESNLAYVIYTSGSTGRPKGVAIEHRSAVTLVHWGLAAFPPEILMGSLAATSVCFDISIFELFVPLAMGGKVILAPNVVGLPQLAAIGEVTIVNAVPSPMAELVGSRLPEGLRIVNLGGEALKADLVERIYAHPQVERVCNLYGPSEDTTYSTCAWVPKGASLVTIGRPIANTEVRVLGRHGEPVPQGAHGELFLSGAGLSRGYLGRPELTADRFVPDPFGPPGARMYRTGDRVRFLPDGELDFLGRFDHQVKLHGIRMELGEIEAVLEQHPAVRQGVAALRSDGPEGARLVGYLVPEVVSEEGMDALAADVAAFLRARLPGTMVPTAWVVLPALPLSPNGKVDRRLLPAPARAGGAGAVAPRNPAEETLAALWSEVLGLERVGVHDDFFELGGHSLLAVRAAFRTAEAFGVEVPVAALFQAPTIAELAEWLERTGSRAAPPAPAVPGEVDGEHPLSFAQHRLWFLDRLRPGGSLYNLQVVVRLAGRLDVAVLGRALAEIVRRHEPLRTVYPDRDGDPFQEVLPPPAEPPLSRLSLAGLPGDSRERALDAVIHAAVERPFDLLRGPVEQFLLIETGPEERLLAAAFHHIATDGWSMGLFAGELAALYAAFADGRPSPLPELPLRYVDLAAAERRELAGPVLEPRLAYWRQQLAGLPPLDLPGDRPRKLVPSPRAIAERIDLPDGLAASLRGLGRGSGIAGITPFMVLLGGFTALLARLTGQEDFGVGVPTAGRQRPEAQGMIGLFVNTLVVRTPLGGDPAFLDLLQRVRDVTVAAQVHQDVPFDKLVDELQPDRGSALTPLFQVLFTYLSDPESPLRMPGVSATLLDLGPMVTQFDLTLALHEWEGRLHGWLSFRADLFEAATAARMAGHLRTLLAAAAAEPGRRLWDLPLLSAGERDQLVDWSGDGSRTWSGGPEPALATTVHRLFEERARLAPADPALISGEETVSYAGLDARANRLARHLLALGIGPEARIAVWLERSVELDVAMLAALKAGGVYLPIDAANPPERVRWLLEDSGAAVLVSREELAARLPLAGAPARVLVDRDVEAIAGRGAEASGVAVDPRALAYVIYTSGSTGRPKGVGVPHGAAAAHLEAVRRYYGLGPGDRTLQFTSPGFDAAVEQFLAPLIAGAALVVRGAELWTARELTRRIGELGLTYVNLPTAYWNRWVNDPGEPGEPDGVGPVSPPLRLVMTGGQEMLGANARLWFRSPMAAARLLNGYGPTETVITPTLHEVRPEDGEAAVVPVGRPVPGRSGWIVDRAGNLVPPGVPGELLLGGPLARGYLDRPDLTAEGFVPDNFSGRPGERLYRTGDRARHRPDGVLEFLGRIDAQVKVRGFRVEPGEIEALLTRHPQVREAVVVAREDAGSDRSLAAYVVAVVDAGNTGDAGEDLAPALQAHLRESLPEYMVPAAWVILPSLPLNANGKVDRRALPVPVPAELGEKEGSAPSTPEEELLAGLFAGLLGRERVGADDDFFALGGHSLLATQLASRVRALFGVELPLAEIFERPTPAGLADRLGAARRAAVSGGGAEPPPLVREESATAPLSFAQQRLWFLHQLDPAAEAYQAPGALRLRGPLNEAALERALGEIVRRHEALRTVFRVEGSAPVQVVLPPPAARLPVADLAALPKGAREREATRLLAREARRPFALERGPLARFLLLRLGREDRLLVMVMHHVVSDAWSLGVLVRELTALYAAFTAGEPSPLPELPVQYPDFARWQRRWLAGETLEREVAHWRRALAGAPESLELPYDRPPGPATGTRGGRRPFELPAGLYGGLLELARRDGWTPFMALLAGFQALLARLAHDDGQEDVVVGSPVANRNRLELEGLIGFFTNTLALRLDLSGDPSFWELGRRVRAVALDAYSHQDVPFEKLVEELAPERQPGRNPLFQAMLVLQKLPAPPALPGVAAELLDVDAGTAKFDLALLLVEAEGAAAGVLEYARDLFDEATVDRLLGHLRTLIEGAVEDPGRRLSALPLLTLPEREELRAWSRPLTPEPATLLIHQGVAAQAARTPDAVAVVFGEGGGETLSYAELTARSRRLARRLRALGVGPDVPVGLFLERSADLMVALLAVLEAGGAYLPLDPGYPAERLRLMLEDAHAPLLLTHAPLAATVPAGAGRVVRVDEPEGLDEEDGSPIPLDVLPDHLVYVIYTSGSTGRPKGVAMTHGALSAMLRWQLRTSSAGAGRTLQFTSMSFDVSFQEIFSTWWSGGALVLVSEETRRDPAALTRLLAERRVERLFLPFVALQQVATAAVAADEDPGAFPSSLREVMSAGEQLFVTPQVAELFARLSGAALYNHYGPSEAHAITWLALAGDPALWPERPAIGAPVDHARIFLLDAGLQPVPVGVTGEIWVGGPGLGRGYLGRSDLTAERFLPDPFAGDAGVDGIGAPPGGRLYRTGDLARRRPDGVLEYLGRRDFQVKIRGQRVELFEVEAALARHPAVRQAAVAVRGDGAEARRLVAYVNFQEGTEPPAFAGLREFLAASLPDPMVPSAWARVDALPLTATGKLDRRALARIEPEEGTGGASFVAPRTPAEELLAEIWRQVLDIGPLGHVGAHDDFFQLGGHSLLATQVASRIRQSFGVSLPLRRIFESSTLGAMAAAILDVEGGGPPAPPIRRAPRDGDLPLSFAQERLWFLHRLQPESPAYNIPLVLRAEGPLDPVRLAAALSAVARRHEVLRTVFAERDGEPVQVVLPAAEVPLPIVDLGALPADRREAEAGRIAAAEAARPFDLARGPLLRAVLLELAARRRELLLNLHHIVTDGWSMGVLVREVKALYAGAPLPEPPVQYADFAVWQRGWLAGEPLERQIAWWRERLRGASTVLELPADHPRPPVLTQRGAEHPFALSRELSRGISALARQEGVTPFMVLAATLFALLARLTGQRDLTIGSPIANRNHLETEELIGFFVNTLVLRADLSRAGSFRDLLRQVRESSLGAYAHQDLPFEKLVDEIQPGRDLSRSPLFQVAVALQNAPLPVADLGGVRLAAEEISTGIAKFDLSFVFAEMADGELAGILQYATDLFAPATAARYARHFAILLAGLVARPRARLAAAPLLSPEECHQILREWNDTCREWPGDPALHELFERQADLQPGAPAVLCGDAALTYGELEARANRLAHHLRSLGVGRSEPVGLWMRRSLDLPAAVLGILKAGAIYMPLDAAWPAERVETILAGTGARALVAGSALLRSVREIEGRLPALRHVICPEEPAPRPAPETDSETVAATTGRWTTARHVARCPETRPVAACGADDVAYLIHTSGSTGEPKGIVIRHRGAANTLRWNNETLGIGPGDRHLFVNSIGFDLSIYDILGMLGAGAAVRVATEEELQDPARLAALLSGGGITTWNSAPAALQRLAPFFPAPGEGRDLRRALLAGDWIPLSLPDAVRTSFPQALVGNFGGATETSVWSNWHRVGAVDPAWTSIPYGRPIANVRYYVLDAELSPCPPGVPGDNHIGGEGLALGYAGLPALTAERFLPDPFSPEPGARMYATGDRVRFWADGTMEFLGRIDSQVKVRGYRIELGEIESALLRHAGIREAVVLAREDVPGEKRLVGYVVPAGTETPAPATAELRAFLRETLPEYMVPWSFVELEALPVTANGKLDREALPAPRELAAGSAQVAPRNDLERAIGAVWCEVLGLDRVGVQESFFEAGGSSLLLGRVQSRLRQAIGREVPFVDLFRHPTIESLARSLEGTAPPPEEQAEAARARTETRRESMRQLQQARGQRRGRKGDR
jgi:amino acid adenylation domain-containing protein